MTPNELHQRLPQREEDRVETEDAAPTHDWPEEDDLELNPDPTIWEAMLSKIAAQARRL